MNIVDALNVIREYVKDKGGILTDDEKKVVTDGVDNIAGVLWKCEVNNK